jgi:hypothetical protein
MRTVGKTKKIKMPRGIIAGLVVLLSLFVWPYGVPTQAQYATPYPTPYGGYCSYNNGGCGCNGDPLAQYVTYLTGCTGPCNPPQMSNCTGGNGGQCVRAGTCAAGCHATYCYNDSNIGGCEGGGASHDDCTEGSYVCGPWNGQGPLPTDVPVPTSFPCPTHNPAVCGSSGTTVSLSWSALTGASAYQMRLNKEPFGDWANYAA